MQRIRKREQWTQKGSLRKKKWGGVKIEKEIGLTLLSSSGGKKDPGKKRCMKKGPEYVGGEGPRIYIIMREHKKGWGSRITKSDRNY